LKIGTCNVYAIVNQKVLKAHFIYIQTLDMLEKKEKVLEKKANAELERAKEFSKAKNKRGTVNHNDVV
jgi:hypothetical protein